MTGCPVGYKQPPRPNNYNLFATFATLGKFPSCTWIFDQLYKIFLGVVQLSHNELASFVVFMQNG